MGIKVVLFDLDGTLLPMDQDVFVKAYFKGIAAKLAPHGYEPKALIDAIWAGTIEMIKNDGQRTNEEAFWDYFASIYGEKSLADMSLFEKFYIENFDAVKEMCGYNPMAAETVENLKKTAFLLPLLRIPYSRPLQPRNEFGGQASNPKILNSLRPMKTQNTVSRTHVIIKNS